MKILYSAVISGYLGNILNDSPLIGYDEEWNYLIFQRKMSLQYRVEGFIATITNILFYNSYFEKS